MKKDKVGISMLLLGAAAFAVPLLIKFYQEDILLGIAVTGMFMIATSLVIILTSKVKKDDNTRTN